MMTRRFLLVVALALCLTTGTLGFMPTRKKSADRRTSFTNNNNGNNNSNEDDVQASATAPQTQYKPSTSPTAAFSVPPSAMVAAFHEYEYEEEEEEVTFEVALISCIVSLAIGFGTGYLV